MFDVPEFVPLFEKIAAAVKLYSIGLGIQPERLNFYFQRSWATVSREGQRIFEHAHLQSHISFAYYLQKPIDGGDYPAWAAPIVSDGRMFVRGKRQLICFDVLDRKADPNADPQSE